MKSNKNIIFCLEHSEKNVYLILHIILLDFQLGSGFKLGPVTGEFLANLATGKPPKFSNEPFLASRFDSVGTSSLQSYL